MALNKDRIFKAADGYIRSNKIEKAIAEYEKWLKANKKDWNTTRQVGDLYARIGRNDEAIRNYSIVADHYRRDGFNVRAIATHKMILRLDPQNEVAMRNLAELQLEQGLVMEAKSQYQALVASYSKSGKKRSATEVFKKLAELDPSDLKVRYKFADFLDKQGKRDEAVQEYIGIAEEFMNKGLIDEGVKILEKAAGSGPSVALDIKLAEASGLSGDHDKSVKLLEGIQIANPDNLVVVAKLGEAYLGTGQTDRAGAAFKSLIEKDPANPAHTARLADFYILQSHNDEALELLMASIDRHVTDRDGDKAVTVLNKILTRSPHHVKSLVKLAEVHTILKQENGRIAAYSSLCEAYSKAADYEQAVQVAEQLVELDSENSQHKDRLIFLQSKLGKTDEQADSSQPQSASNDQILMDSDLEPLDGVDEAVELGKAVSGTFTREEILAASSGQADLGEVVELSPEDEEHVREKLTEAEVFVRYGLVDKAISQLVDVLDGFRFHVEARNKLIEIYEENGMNREAGEQMFQLGHVLEKLGQLDEAKSIRTKASALAPGEAAHAVTADIATDEFVGDEIDDDEEIEISFSDDDQDLDIEVETARTPEPELEEIDLGSFSDDDEEVDLGDLSIETAELDDGRGEEILFEERSLEEEIPLDLAAASESEASGSSDGISQDLAAKVPGPGDSDMDLALDGQLAALDSSVTNDDIVVEFEDDEEFDLEVGEDGIAGVVPEAAAATVTEEAIGLESNDLEGLQDIQGIEDIAELEELQELEDIEVDFGEPLEEAGSAKTGEADEIGAGDGFGDIGLGVDGGDLADELRSTAASSVPIASTDPVHGEVTPDDISSAATKAVEPVGSVDIDDLSQRLDELGQTQEGFDEELITASLPASEGDDDAFEIDIPAEPPSLPASAEGGADSGSISLLDELGGEEPNVEPAVLPASGPDIGEQLAPVSTALSTPLAAELEEVDEYITLGLYEDAKDTLRELLAGAPEDLAVAAKIEELGFSVAALRGGADAEPSAFSASQQTTTSAGVSGADPFGGLVADGQSESAIIQEPTVAAGNSQGSTSNDGSGSPLGDGFVDLASELSEEIFGTHSAIAGNDRPSVADPATTDPGLDELFREFRKGVEKQLGTEDYDTRYNLGIAYKEMGLIDEAIAEFQLASKDEERALECCSMLGLCFMEKGMPQIAVKWFSKGLALPGRREEEYHGLRYDLAQAYEATTQRDQALELYMEIFRHNARFRDVKDKVRVLQEALK